MKRLLLLSLILIPCVLQAQVFGIIPGDSIDNYTVVMEIGGGGYEITPPNPVTFFSNYIVTVDPINGITDIIAITKEKRMNSFASEPLADMDKMESMVLSKYGEPARRMRSALPGSIWTDDNELSYALYLNEAKMYSAWNGDGDLKGIIAYISPQSMTTYIASIGFSFNIESTVEEESIF